MRVAQIYAPYPSYLDFFNRELFSDPAASSYDYEALKRRLDEDSMGWTDQWKEPLAERGIEYENFTTGFPRLQELWADENGLKSTGAEEVLVEQLKRYQPEVLLILNFDAVSKQLLDRVSVELPRLRSKILWCGAPLPASCPIEQYDLVLTCVPELEIELSKQMRAVRYMAHSFDPRILSRVQRGQKQYPLSFIGQVALRPGFHFERNRVLRKLLNQKTPIHLFVPEQKDAFKESFKYFVKKAVVKTGNALGPARQLFARVPKLGAYLSGAEVAGMAANLGKFEFLHQPVFGLKMYQTLAESFSSLNVHIDISRRSASNMRVYEASGMGSCLLTDWKADLSSILDPDYECVSFRSPEECASKARYLIEHPEEACAIGERAQKRVLKEHCVEHRAGEFSKILKEQASSFKSVKALHTN